MGANVRGCRRYGGGAFVQGANVLPSFLIHHGNNGGSMLSLVKTQEHCYGPLRWHAVGLPRQEGQFWPAKEPSQVKTKHTIKHKTSPARLAQLLQPSLALCFSLQPMTAYRPVLDGTPSLAAVKCTATINHQSTVIHNSSQKFTFAQRFNVEWLQRNESVNRVGLCFACAGAIR